MNAAAWLTVAAVTAGRILYPRIVERRQARRFALNSKGIIQGAESIDLERPGAPGVLVLHGGGDTPQSMALLARHLYDHGYSVRAPLLAHHGESLEAFGEFDATEWRAQVRREYEAMRAKHNAVFVVGQSVGGALALDLAASHEVAALILMAPWVAMKPLLLFIARTSPIWGWMLPYLSSMGGHSIYDPAARAQVLTRGIVTPKQLRAFADVAEMAQEALPRVSAPTLTIQSRTDGRITSESAQAAFDRLGSADKKFEWTTGAGHVISVDYGKERVFRLATDWLDAHRR